MKTCSRCGIAKPEEDFRFCNKAKGRRASWCRPCFSQYEREKWASDENRRKTNAYHNNERRIRNQQFIWDWLNRNPCVHCGEADPVVLEFDHRDPSKKFKTISDLSRSSYSINKITAEIAECDVLCANCHRRRTAKQFDWYKNLIMPS